MTARLGSAPLAVLLLGVSALGCGEHAVIAPRPTAHEARRRVEAAPIDARAEALAATLVVVAPEPPGGQLAAIDLATVPTSEALAPASEVRTDDAARFFDHDDAPILEALANEAIVRVERGNGGRSLSFKITLADGTRGYFKPEQTFNGMSWYAEIAAYHLDRELGLGRVAPVVGRRIPWSELREAADGDRRVDELIIGEDGTLRGALVWWVPERLTPLPLEANWERWLRIEGEPDAITPFQRPNHYRAARAAGAAPRSEGTPEPDVPERPAELSDLIVFDYLVQNLDRWGTNNTNVRTLGPGGPLMFLDNAASFTLRRARIGLMDTRLHHVQRFRRATIDAVRALDVAGFEARLAADPLAPALDPGQLENLEARRQHLLAYVDALIEAHGEDAVYAW